MLRFNPAFAELFDATVVAESGVTADIRRLGASLADFSSKANATYAAKHGEDLFKPTNKTVPALTRLGVPITS